MIDMIVVGLIRQAVQLTSAQQEALTTKAAEAVAILVRATDTEIDEALLRALLPMASNFVEKLEGSL